ncbi:MAG: hypothetical protein QOF56_3300 [Acidobacteriaceae bacterium]|jgi:hypothetical protein|nr:hypothetical protein [Acidobacteriaceae bacterium]
MVFLCETILELGLEVLESLGNANRKAPGANDDGEELQLEFSVAFQNGHYRAGTATRAAP